MPACTRASTSLMSWLFFAVRSSSSLVLLISGVVSLRTYFLLAQPRVEAIANASMNVNEVRFIVKRLLLSNLCRLSTWVQVPFRGPACTEQGGCHSPKFTLSSKCPPWNNLQNLSRIVAVTD